MEKAIKKAKIHMFFIIMLLLINIIYLHKLLIPDSTFGAGDDFNDAHLGAHIIQKDSWLVYHKFFALWDPYLLSGTPLLSKGYVAAPFYPLNVLLLLVPNTILAAKLILFFSYFIAGVAMYILGYYLFKEHYVAFIAALFYVYNGFSLMFLQKGWSEYIRAFCLTPFIFFCLFKAFKSKEWLKYALLTSVLLSMQIFAGGPNIFLWTMVMLGFFLLFKLIGRNFRSRLVKTALIGIVIVLFAYCLSAVMIFIMQDQMKVSSRAVSVTRQEALEWQKIDLVCNDESYRCLYELFSPKFTSADKFKGGGLGIGIIGTILVLIAVILKWKNRNVIFFTILAIISILLALGTPLMYLLWKYAPGFAGHRYPHRALFMFAFSASVLIGYGVGVLTSKIKDRFSDKKKIVIAVIMAALILTELLVFGVHQRESKNIRTEIENNQLYQYISKQPGIFRFQAYEILGITRGLNHITVPLKLNYIYGYDTLWEIEYLPIYLSVANNDPAKFFGMLNVKYITSSNPVNVSGFKFIKRFEPSPYTINEEINQTYLYENERFLPRAYIANNAILVAGSMDAVKQTAYALMLDQNFNPASTVVVMGEKGAISSYNIDFLKRFDVIVLTQDSVDANSELLLTNYAKSGGILVPNILEGKNSITNEEVSTMLGSLKGNTIPLDKNIKYDSFDKMEIKLDKNYDGFLVLSEKFAFHKWTTTLNGNKKELLMADGIISAVPLDNESGTVIFEYKPKSFTTGLMITEITALVISGYFAYYFIRKRKKGKKEIKTKQNGQE